MIRYLVLTFGRPVTWAILIAAPLVLIFAAIGIATTIPDADSTPEPIAPNEALEQGGYTVEVCIVCAASGEPVDGGRFSVTTLDGRPPSMSDGYLSGNLAQIVVVPDWIGKVWIYTDFGSETTDLVGEAYGWHDRVLEIDCPDDTPTGD